MLPAMFLSYCCALTRILVVSPSSLIPCSRQKGTTGPTLDMEGGGLEDGDVCLCHRSRGRNVFSSGGHIVRLLPPERLETGMNALWRFSL